MENYLTMLIDGEGAGIGHKLYNWYTGFYYSKLFNVRYLYTNFPNVSDSCRNSMNLEWESFLGLNLLDDNINDIDLHLYEKYYLPAFNYNDDNDIDNISNIISSNKNKIFILKPLQLTDKSYEVGYDLFLRYSKSHYRNIISNTFDNNYINIVVHIRRGETYNVSDENCELTKERYIPLTYYLNIMRNIIKYNSSKKKIMFHLYSENNIEDINLFKEFNISINLCDNMLQIFTNFVESDGIVCGKSGFSHQTAYMNNKMIFIYENFFTPNSWIECNNNGDFDIKKYRNKLKMSKM